MAEVMENYVLYAEACGVLGDKPENESQEEELQITSKKIVEKAVLQAVQQYTQEKKQKKKPEAKKSSQSAII
ncbi:A-kinase anchor protein inhibitor 1-like [Mobula hypostoma]|uniref:A-kinase anchor protein inhibitor 1-like n=1 Tax=Mobula hypostoma TaxID=723540 RepID=UPI002FC3A805